MSVARGENNPPVNVQVASLYDFEIVKDHDDAMMEEAMILPPNIYHIYQQRRRKSVILVTIGG